MPCDKDLKFYIYQPSSTDDRSVWYAAKHTTAWDLYKTLCRAYDLSPSSPIKHFSIRHAGNDDSSCEGGEDK